MPKVDQYEKPWFAFALRELREERGWSVAELAERVAASGHRGRVSAEYVRKLERGSRVPSLMALGALLAAFGMTRAELEARFEPQALMADAAPAAPPQAQVWSSDVGGGPAPAAAFAAAPERPSPMRSAGRALAFGARKASPPAPAAPPPPADDGLAQAAELMALFARLTPAQRAVLVAHAASLAQSR